MCLSNHVQIRVLLLFGFKNVRCMIDKNRIYNKLRQIDCRSTIRCKFFLVSPLKRAVFN